MHHCTCLAMTFGAFVLVLAASTSSASTIPVIVCPPGLKEAPASVRKLCTTLLEIETPPEEGDMVDAPVYEHHANDIRGVKRQDVDHVFLRFGRRYGL